MQERVLSCYEMIQSKIRKRLSANKTIGRSTSFSPESPIAVLEMPCLSRTTEDTIFSNSNGDSRSPMSKRRRISR
jgi:hypothetical protein